MNTVRFAPPLNHVGPYVIRPAEPDDAAAALAFFQRVRGESPYLLLEPGEGIRDVETQRRQFLSMYTERKQAIFFAFYESQPIGFVGVSRGGFSRNLHVANLAIAVEASHRRHGVGESLTRVAAAWALAEGVKRLELTVATENLGAISLYKAEGFIEEGTKRKSFRIGKNFVDELSMARIFPD